MNRAVYCGVALLGMLTGCTRGIDQQKFAGVYKAGQDIKGATSVGLTLVRYRELLGTFASQVAQAKDAAKSEHEQLMVSQYENALSNYSDAAKVWGAKVEHGATLLIQEFPEGPELATKYNLTMHPAELRPEVKMLYADEAMQEIWQRAGQHLAMANTMYTGKSQE